MTRKRKWDFSNTENLFWQVFGCIHVQANISINVFHADATSGYLLLIILKEVALNMDVCVHAEVPKTAVRRVST